MLTNRLRFALKVNAPATAATATAVPTSALLTGTAVRPRPGSSAIRAPTTTGAGSPLPARPLAMCEARSAPASSGAPSTPGRDLAARHAGQADRANRTTTMATNPKARTAMLTSTPG